MDQVASREILWNVGSLTNVVVMYAIFAFSMLIALTGILRRAELWTSGKPAPERLGDWGLRFIDLLQWVVLQRGVLREKTAALAHTLIFIGFLALLFATTMVFIDHDLGIRIYQGNFYLFVTILSDLLGIGLLFGCGIAAHRRYIKRADMVHNRPLDWLLLATLSVLVIQGFVLEGLRIHVTADPWAAYSPIGLLFARFFWFLSAPQASALHYFFWWFHAVTVFAFVAVVPYSKFFHVLASSVNLFFRRSSRPKGALPYPGDIGAMMEAGDEFSIGLGTIKDYTWKQLLDLDACTSCGRCQDACPAYASGKPLSPKWVVLDTRNHALSLMAQGKLGAESLAPAGLKKIDSWLTNSLLLRGSGLVKPGVGPELNYQAGFRAKNELVRDAEIHIGASVDARIAGEVMDPMAFWSCTTCMACVEACPVGIQHVDQIVENRRNMVVMQGELPKEAQGTLRALEQRGNPYGAPEDRIKWIEDLDVRIVEPGDSVDYLYWVGCVSSYDPRKQKIARSLVKLMKAAGLSFGILGTAEGCTGDPARRLGEENLFQTMAKMNIETLKGVRFQTLVANCPHCFNTIKNEYPQFGNLGEGKQPEIIHHSQLLRKLLAEDKLKLSDESKTFTFHDPCYLGRYNDEYDAPRESLRGVKSLKIVEMDRSREKGMCCGAGGGHFWMDLKIGTRVNAMRADQAAETGASNVATACPFCLQMMEDGIKITNRDEQMQVKDIAEVLAEHLVD